MAVTPISKAVFWILGLMGSIYALSAALASWYFGYVDLNALAEMAIVFLPLAAAGVGAILFVERGAIRSRISRWHPAQGDARGGALGRPVPETLPTGNLISPLIFRGSLTSSRRTADVEAQVV